MSSHPSDSRSLRTPVFVEDFLHEHLPMQGLQRIRSILGSPRSQGCREPKAHKTSPLTITPNRARTHRALGENDRLKDHCVPCVVMGLKKAGRFGRSLKSNSGAFLIPYAVESRDTSVCSGSCTVTRSISRLATVTSSASSSCKEQACSNGQRMSVLQSIFCQTWRAT
eukprot:3066925-Amphidinium_carterae.1